MKKSVKRKVKRKVTEIHDRNMLILSLRVLFVSTTQLLSQALCMKTGVDHHACETTLVHSKHTAVRFLCSFETQPNSSHACAFVCPDAHDRTEFLALFLDVFNHVLIEGWPSKEVDRSHVAEVL